MIKINIDGCRPFLTEEVLKDYIGKARTALQTLDSGRGAGAEFTGWNELPQEIPAEMVEECIGVVDRWVAKDVDLVVCIGIGGSYLGVKAAIEALSHTFASRLESNGPSVVFAGNNLSEEYIAELKDLMAVKNVAAVVISKSGTTTEPAVAFRIVKNFLERKYGREEAADRIVAITDAAKGALRTLATQEGYQTFVIPDNVGGRYSVLTPVGLLPIALAGFDINALLDGARNMQRVCDEMSDSNPAILYAALRNALYDSGKKIELFVGFNPKLQYVAEWWKQLYGESEGKEGKGIFPASVMFTTDLHSMGQYIQQGERILMETVVNVESSRREVIIEHDEQDLDGLNYLDGCNVEHCNNMARLGTKLAHIDGGVPNVEISIEQIDEYNLGQLFYFFEKACGISAYILGINPFDQPGVEAYKKNMFALLGKPGYEEAGEKLRSRL